MTGSYLSGCRPSWSFIRLQHRGNGCPGPSSGLEIVKQVLGVLHAVGLARQPMETENVSSTERHGLCVGGGARGASPCISVLLGVREERSALGMGLRSGATPVCVPLAMQTPWRDMGKQDSLTLTEIGPNIPQTCLSKVSKDPLIISEHFFYQLPHARF